MKVIFLDVDGVLNSSRSMVAYHDEHMKLSKGSKDVPLNIYHRIDPVAVRLLNRITDVNPEVKYVISSTHRKHIPDPLGNGRNMDEMRNYFRQLGLTGEVIGYTGVSDNGHRGTEIQKYVNNYFDETVSHWAILDDDLDMTNYQKAYHFVNTEGEVGLSYKNYKELLAILECKERN